MKNFKQFCLVFILLSALILPTFVYAAWWNPLSWNWNIFSWFAPHQMPSNNNMSSVQKNNSAQSTTEKNSQSPTMVSSSVPGLTIEVLQQGSGPEAKKGDKVTVNYIGTLQDGTTFDSSYARNMPFTFDLGQGEVIQGWDLGVIGMKVGEKRKLTIVPDLAYGQTGVPGVIPANATLTFEVELLTIN